MIEKDKKSWVNFTSYFSVFVASSILCIKVYAFFKTDSVSIFASLVDSLLDIASSVVNLLAIRYSALPADDNHRFGHDKIQDLAIFAQSMFFGASGIVVLFLSIPRVFDPTILANDNIAIIGMLFSMLLTCILVIVQSYVIRISGSKIIKIDKLHYFVDLLSNMAVLCSIMIVKYFGWSYVDPIFAIMISLYIIYSAYGFFMESIKNLLDEEFSDEERKKIIDIIGEEKSITAIHELKTRRGGNKSFIQFHMEMDPEMSLMRSHEISVQIEEKILLAFPESEIIIHQDPAGFEENVLYQIRFNRD